MATSLSSATAGQEEPKAFGKLGKARTTAGTWAFSEVCTSAVLVTAMLQTPLAMLHWCLNPLHTNRGENMTRSTWWVEEWLGS